MLGLGFGLSSRAVLGGGMSVAAYLAAAGLTSSNAGADFDADRYWLPSSDAQSAPRWSSRSEFFAQFARASTATYIDAGGVLRTASANEPRFDYSSGSRRLLLEGAATNLVNAFWSSSWTPSRGVKTPNQPDPAGGAEAVLFTCDGNSDPIMSLNLSTGNPSGKTFTFSFWAKTVTRNNNEARKLMVFMYGSSGVEQPQTQTIDITDTWARYKATLTFPAGMSSIVTVFRIDPFDGLGGGVQIPSAGSSIMLFGAQVEESASMSSYLYTGGSAVSRAVDAFRLPTALEGVIQLAAASALVRASSIRPGTSGSDVTQLLGGTSPVFLLGSRSQTSVRTYNGSIILDGTLGTGGFSTGVGTAVGYDGSGRSVSANSGAVASDANTIGSRLSAFLGRHSNGGAFGEGLYKQLAVFPTRLSNAQLQTLAVP